MRSASGGRKHRRLENLLIVSETAFALILLAGAGLLMRTFAGLTAISPGFRPDHVLTARISLPYWKYPGAQRQRAFLDEILEKVRLGVLAYAVEQRSHEIGIRLALGAERRHIMGLILGRGLMLSIAGAAIGTAGGTALTRYLKSLLYGVTPHDPATLSVGCAVVIAVALAAAYLPARRALRQDPMATLRAE